MDLQKAYDTIDQHDMWQMLRVYGVGGKLFKAVQSFYVDSRACVRVGNDVSVWFKNKSLLFRQRGHRNRDMSYKCKLHELR